MAALNPLKFLTVNPISKHTASVIFIHGLGDSGDGWKPVAEMLSKSPKLKHVRWILPHAPIQPVSMNMGMSMPSWFDIVDLDDNPLDDHSSEDEKGMLESSVKIGKLVETEIEVIEGLGTSPASSRVVVGGFSQGAAMSLLHGFTSERKLAGVVSLSGWLPLRKKMKSMIDPSSRKMPVFFGHGTADPLVKYNYGKRSYEFLQNTAPKSPLATDEDIQGLTWKEYPGMAHSCNEEEIQDLQAWLEKVLPPLEENTAST